MSTTRARPRTFRSIQLMLGSVGHLAGRWLRRLCIVVGAVALLMIVLAFTRIPFDAHRSLASTGGSLHQVDLVVVLGGSGMPSGPELLRTYYGATVAMEHPAARVVVVHPKDTGVVQAMTDELVMRGITPARIIQVMEGTNTREQALVLASRFAARAPSIAVVTAPENIRRTVLSLRKAGFAHVQGVPAFDHAMFVDLSYDHRRLGGSKAVPDVSGNLDLRYNFWNYLKLEITCLREYVALAYYRLNGWI